MLKHKMIARICIYIDDQLIQLFCYKDIGLNIAFQDALSLAETCMGCTTVKDYCHAIAERGNVSDYWPKEECRLDDVDCDIDFILNLSQGTLSVENVLDDRDAYVFSDPEQDRLWHILRDNGEISITAIDFNCFDWSTCTPESILFKQPKVQKKNPFDSGNKILKEASEKIIVECDRACVKVRKNYDRGLITEDDYLNEKLQIALSDKIFRDSYRDEYEVLSMDNSRWRKFQDYLMYRMGVRKISYICSSTTSELGQHCYSDGSVYAFSNLDGVEQFYKYSPEKDTMIHFYIWKYERGTEIKIPVAFKVRSVETYRPWSAEPHRYPWKSIEGYATFSGYCGEGFLNLMPDDEGGMCAKLIQKCYIDHKNPVWQSGTAKTACGIFNVSDRELELFNA